MAESGNFFEDFRLGQIFHHGPPRTLTLGDQSVYTAIYGSRFALQSSVEIARNLGYTSMPIDDFLVFHTVFGKTVPEISLNAVANLGYADCRFLRPVYAGDTLTVRSEVIGLRENSNRESGIVYVKTAGANHLGESVLTYIRWVMVRKRSKDTVTEPTPPPPLPEIIVPQPQAVQASREKAKGAFCGKSFFENYTIGQQINHADGVTIEDAEHMMAARLFHNTARVHFNDHSEKKGRFGRRLVYGGHIISMARALSCNGLENAVSILGINAGRHVAPCFGGDTIYAWSQILDKLDLKDAAGTGALRIRTIAAKDQDCSQFPFKQADNAYHPSVVLDLDYWVAMPHRSLA